MSAADPTLEFLRSLEDPALYQIKDGIPAFVAHERKFKDKDGKVHVIKVTVDDLHKIAAEYNRRVEETGTPIILKLGHVRQEEDEEHQPPVVGAATNLRVGKFGPSGKPALLYKSHIRLDKLGKVRDGGFCWRSPEFYPARKQITAIALLNRDPELDLGAVSYQHTATTTQQDGSLLCYSREVNMPDPTMPPDAASPVDAPVDAPVDKPGEGPEMESYMRHCASHPYARGYHEKMLKYAAEAASPAMPGAENVSVPGAGDEPPAAYAKDAEMLAYAKQQASRVTAIERQNAILQAELTKSQQTNLSLQYAKELVDLGLEHGMDEQTADEFAAKEMKRCQTYSRQQFDSHKEHVGELLTYQADPTRGSLLPINPDRPGQSDKPLEGSRFDRAVEYMREQKCTWNDAVKHVRQNAG